MSLEQTKLRKSIRFEKKLTAYGLIANVHGDLDAAQIRSHRSCYYCLVDYEFPSHFQVFIAVVTTA